MPLFRYRAIDSQNNSQTNTIEAPSKKDLILNLRNEGLIVVSVEEVQAAFSITSKKFKTSGRKKKIKLDDIAIFCRQLSTLINAGVNLLEGVEDVSEMAANPSLRDLLKKISAGIKEGKTFSDALSEHKVFSKTIVSMVAVGEKTGKLAKVLSDLAAYLENNVKLQRKVKAASMYPIIVASIALGVLGVMVFWLIPMFEDMYKSFGSELPLPTQMVMAGSRFIVSKFPFIIAAVIGLYALFKIILKTPVGRNLYDRSLFRIPIFGAIYAKVILARFFQTLSTLVKSGVDIVGSLEISAKVADNVYIENILNNIKERVTEGNQLGAELAKYPIFPRMVTRMTAVGEKSGQLDAMFDKITDYYSDEVDTAVSMLGSVMEPILIVLLGGIVGTFVVAMYLPIFNMVNAMSSGL